MNQLKLLFIGLVSWFLVSCNSTSEGVLTYVDPMIGTDGHGHTFPGATIPFGMVQLSPSNGWKAWDWCSGYHYSDSIIKGFAHTHISGAGLSGLGDILVMPTLGKLNTNPGTEENPDEGYRSRFSHDREQASAGYYSVMLDDYEIHVELTTSKRVGFHKYTFNKEGDAHIIIDPTHRLMESLIGSEVEIVSGSEIRGYKHCDGEAGKRKVYFYANFSKPFVEAGLALNDSLVEDKKLTDRDTRAWVKYNVGKGDQLEVKVALSFVSYEGALKNLKAEGETTNFTSALADAKNRWEEQISKIKIKGSSEQKRTFYTAMYHSFISPNLISDVDGNYIIEGEKYYSSHDHYSNFSTWDSYRSLHPLLTILEHEKTADFVNSLSSRYSVSKVGLPVWELLGHDNACMIGYSTTSPMADAILKNVPGIDVDAAYEAMRAAAHSLDKHSPNYDLNGMAYYVELGYIPGEVGCAVSKTTEQNYYDWAIGKVAEKIGRQEDAEMFDQRSKSFLHLYNPEKQYLWPKMLNGNWQEMSLDKWDELITNYVSGNIWAYSAYTPHYMAGIINKMGGRDKYEAWLDEIIADTTEVEGGMHVDISGFIGKYGHGDEPGHQIPYLYNYVGAPHKTQKLVRQVADLFYSDQPDGLVNNEDLGQMSSWYVFSTLGFYPVCPGNLQYAIGSPHYKEASIATETGNTFTIKAPKTSAKNIYVQSVKLNGEEYNLPFITHNDIMNGGLLEFEMGPEPSGWGSEEEYVRQLSGNDLTTVTAKSNVEIVYNPYEEVERNGFYRERIIELKCNSPETQIRYTLDGSSPDENSTLYREPIVLTKDAKLKARAFSNDGRISMVFAKKYFKSLLNDEGLKFKYSLKNAPQHYGDEDGSLLFDGFIGSTNHNDQRWCGFNEKQFDLTIDFGRMLQFSNLTLGYLTDTKVWIFPPAEILVYSSKDGKDFKLLKSVKPLQPAEDLEFTNKEKIEFSKEKAQFIKLVTKNPVLPDWHFGNGRLGWVFIDEVLIH